MGQTAARLWNFRVLLCLRSDSGLSLLERALDGFSKKFRGYRSRSLFNAQMGLPALRPAGVGVGTSPAVTFRFRFDRRALPRAIRHGAGGGPCEPLPVVLVAAWSGRTAGLVVILRTVEAPDSTTDEGMAVFVRHEDQASAESGLVDSASRTAYVGAMASGSQPSFAPGDALLSSAHTTGRDAGTRITVFAAICSCRFRRSRAVPASTSGCSASNTADALGAAVRCFWSRATWWSPDRAAPTSARSACRSRRRNLSYGRIATAWARWIGGSGCPSAGGRYRKKAGH